MKDVTYVKKILRKAARICSTRGMCADVLEDAKGQVCVLGALIIAEHGKVRSNGISNEVYSAVQRTVPDGIVSEWSNELVRAGHANKVIERLRDVAKNLQG